MTGHPFIDALAYIGLGFLFTSAFCAWLHIKAVSQ